MKKVLFAVLLIAAAVSIQAASKSDTIPLGMGYMIVPHPAYDSIPVNYAVTIIDTVGGGKYEFLTFKKNEAGNFVNQYKAVRVTTGYEPVKPQPTQPQPKPEK